MRRDGVLLDQPVVRHDAAPAPPSDDLRVVEHHRIPAEHATRFAVDWAPPEPDPAFVPDPAFEPDPAFVPEPCTRQDQDARDS